MTLISNGKQSWLDLSENFYPIGEGGGTPGRESLLIVGRKRQIDKKLDSRTDYQVLAQAAASLPPLGPTSTNKVCRNRWRSMESSLRCWTHLFIISRPYFQQLLLQCRKNIRELKLESWTRSLIANQKCLLLRPTSLTPVTLYQSSFQQKTIQELSSLYLRQRIGT